MCIRDSSYPEYCGKADIYRWEILYHYGGFFTDADSICLEPLDDLFEKYDSFVALENEKVRAAGWSNLPYVKKQCLSDKYPLIANGAMAFPKHHKLPKMAIDWIKNNDIKGTVPWLTTGPALLTRLYYNNKWDDIKLLPSFNFYPKHHKGIKYTGDGKVYAEQLWGSTFNLSIYKSDYFNVSFPYISVVTPIYNTRIDHFREFIESIKGQVGNLGIELVCIDDGSEEELSEQYKQILDKLVDDTRYIDVIYKKLEKNMGIAYAKNRAFEICSNELVVSVDSDDIVDNTLLYNHYMFMKDRPDVVVRGIQVGFFKDGTYNIYRHTSHENISWSEFISRPSNWFVNHGGSCIRRTKLLDIGGYDESIKKFEDLNLWIRFLHKYGMIHSSPDLLYRYRQGHSGTVTADMNLNEIIDVRTTTVNKLLKLDTDFVFIANVDQNCNDLCKIEGELEQLKKYSIENKNAVAFNTHGWVKHSIKDLTYPPEFKQTGGLFVKKDYLVNLINNHNV